MLEKILKEMGKPIDSDEIKALLSELGLAFPKATTVTPNNNFLKGKFTAHGFKLGFHLGGNHIDLKPIPAKRANSYIARLRFITFDKKTYQGEYPLGVSYEMDAADIDKIIGKPKVIEFMKVITKDWRIPYGDRFELIITETDNLREIYITFPYDPNLDLSEDYE
jgi:hypothetical protein